MKDDIRVIVESSRECFLGTLEAGGAPCVSGTSYLFESKNGFVLWLYLSALARHTANIRRDPRVSAFIIDETKDLSIQERKRVTLLGEARVCEDRIEVEKLKAAYLERFPKAATFIALPDFRFYGIYPREAHWFGGFGTAKTVKIGEA